MKISSFIKACYTGTNGVSASSILFYYYSQLDSNSCFSVEVEDFYLYRSLYNS